jgi:hypothetical protein
MVEAQAVKLRRVLSCMHDLLVVLIKKAAAADCCIIGACCGVHAVAAAAIGCAGVQLPPVQALLVVVVVGFALAVVEDKAPSGASPVPTTAARLVAVVACACPIPMRALVKLPLHVLKLLVLHGGGDSLGACTDAWFLRPGPAVLVSASSPCVAAWRA